MRDITPPAEKLSRGRVFSEVFEMYSVGYHGRRGGLIKPSLFFGLGLLFLLLAAGVYLFLPLMGFLSLVLLCAAGASFVYFGLRKALEAGLLVELSLLLVWIMRVAFFAGLISFIAVECFVLSGSYTSAEADGADTLIVLGCGVDGETPSLMLQSRIDAAADYLLRNPDTVAVLSGGQGPGEDITEAEAMRRALERYGIAGERLVLETESRDTIQNLQNSLALCADDDKVAVLSNDFHLYRARLIAEHEGFSVERVCAVSPRADLSLNYHVREYFSLLKVFFTYLFI